MVADALSRKTSHAINAIGYIPKELYRDFERLEIEAYKRGTAQAMLCNLTTSPSIFEEIRKGQPGDVKLERIRKKIAEGATTEFQICEDGSIRYKERWCVLRSARKSKSS